MYLKPRQNIVYLSAELNRLCRIRVSADISIRGLSPVGGLILPLWPSENECVTSGKLLI